MPTKIDFIGGNTKRCLMAMALPMIAAMFLNMMYNLVDSLWIGNLLGETAYAALTNSTPIILILTSVADIDRQVAVCHIIGFSRGVQSFQNSRKKSLKQNSYKEGENYCHAERCGNQTLCFFLVLCANRLRDQN